MPLHPQIQAMLSDLAAAKLPAFHALPHEQTRALFRQLMTSLPPSTAVLAKVEDRRIANDIPVRIYTPSGTGPFPLLLFFHGGGWVMGDLDTHDATCRELSAGSGCIVVSVDYRCAPEQRFPVAADEGFAALQWLNAHADELGGDASRLAVAGDSAGGNLAAVTANRAQRQLPGAVRAQLLIYPVADHYDGPSASMKQNAEGYLLTRQDMVWFTDHYLGPDGDRNDPDFNLSRARLSADLPPALVITAEFDPLRDEGAAYAAALKKAGVDVRLSPYDGAIHGFFTFFSALELGRKAMDEACAWLRERLQ